MRHWEFKAEVDNADTMDHYWVLADYLLEEFEDLKKEIALYELDELGF